MAQHGGPRTPTNPAAVSGPGSLSRRTDGRQPIMDIPSESYGDGVATHAIEAGAPMAGSPAVPSAQGTTDPTGGGPAQPAPVQPLPLTAGSVLPNQPVTHGADSGPGPGQGSLGLGTPVAQQHSSAASLVQQLATAPNASPTIQYLASKLQNGY